MTPAEQIERDRRRREDELLLLLLLLADESRRDATVALRHGFPVQTVLQNTLGRATPLIAASMADAHADAYRRLGLLAGEPIARADAGNRAELIRIYTPAAADASAAMISTLADELQQTANESPAATPRTLVRDAFETAGYARTNSYGLDLGVERAIVGASNAGMLEASTSLRVGIRHISTLDRNTTDICRCRHGLTLPATHSYWRNGGIPALHWRCRSILLPILPPYEASNWLPQVPVMPGFGYGLPSAFGGIAA